MMCSDADVVALKHFRMVSARLLCQRTGGGERWESWEATNGGWFTCTQWPYWWVIILFGFFYHYRSHCSWKLYPFVVCLSASVWCSLAQLRPISFLSPTPSLSRSLHLSIHLFVYLSIYLPIFLSVCFSIYLSISESPSVPISIYLHLSVCIYLSICLHVLFILFSSSTTLACPNKFQPHKWDILPEYL